MQRRRWLAPLSAAVLVLTMAGCSSTSAQAPAAPVAHVAKTTTTPTPTPVVVPASVAKYDAMTPDEFRKISKAKQLKWESWATSNYDSYSAKYLTISGDAKDAVPLSTSNTLDELFYRIGTYERMAYSYPSSSDPNFIDRATAQKIFIANRVEMDDQGVLQQDLDAIATEGKVVPVEKTALLNYFGAINQVKNVGQLIPTELDGKTVQSRVIGYREIDLGDGTGKGVDQYEVYSKWYFIPFIDYLGKKQLGIAATRPNENINIISNFP